ncbi:MAG: hypothetical protein JRD89_20330 [Deltaproteobacteria bacterium]|nr:hypothetical protein [Deltaproteobacteria bacterium]
MEDLNSFKMRHPDTKKVNVEIFCKIFNAGVAAGGKKRKRSVFTKPEEIVIRKLWDEDSDIRVMWLDDFKAFLAFYEFYVKDQVKIVEMSRG